MSLDSMSHVDFVKCLISNFRDKGPNLIAKQENCFAKQVNIALRYGLKQGGGREPWW